MLSGPPLFKVVCTPRDTTLKRFPPPGFLVMKQKVLCFRESEEGRKWRSGQWVITKGSQGLLMLLSRLTYLSWFHDALQHPAFTFLFGIKARWKKKIICEKFLKQLTLCSHRMHMYSLNTLTDRHSCYSSSSQNTRFAGSCCECRALWNIIIYCTSFSLTVKGTSKLFLSLTHNSLQSINTTSP